MIKKKYDIALIGLGVMGQSLARNIASRGFNTLVFNRTTEKAVKFIQEYGNDYLAYEKSLRSLVKNLKTPRKIIVMVNSGEPVDAVIKQLTPLLSKNDIIIDAGNSNYLNTIRRNEELSKKGLNFVGMGVSGGEEGALRGPSIMPGCTKSTWSKIKPILESIAAKDFSGQPTVTHIGTDGAGHYVKMIHNGIEYGVMQMMAEAYGMLKNIYGLSPDQISAIFKKYNRGKLKSYLFEIAVPILSRKDEFKKGNLIDHILDKAGQKGTGRWTGIDALNKGVALPTITMAVFARNISSYKDQRKKISKLYKKPKSKKPMKLDLFVKKLGDALYAGMISSYAQGFDLIDVAAKEYKWDINFAEVTRIWEGGCIIRAELLNFLHKAFKSKKSNNPHLFTIKSVQTALQKTLPAWRDINSIAMKNGIPAPALATSLTYFESMTSENLTANFIQGLRDFFGAHTYERIDKKGSFHTEWSNLDL